MLAADSEVTRAHLPILMQFSEIRNISAVDLNRTAECNVDRPHVPGGKTESRYHFSI